MPRVVGGSKRGVSFFMSEVPLYISVSRVTAGQGAGGSGLELRVTPVQGLLSVEDTPFKYTADSEKWPSIH